MNTLRNKPTNQVIKSLVLSVALVMPFSVSADAPTIGSLERVMTVSNLAGFCRTHFHLLNYISKTKLTTAEMETLYTYFSSITPPKEAEALVQACDHAESEYNYLVKQNAYKK